MKNRTKIIIRDVRNGLAPWTARGWTVRTVFGALAGRRERVEGSPRSVRERSAARWRAMRAGAADAGMSTAEYAVGTVAACAFAVALYKVVTSSAVSSALSGMIKKALGGAF